MIDEITPTFPELEGFSKRQILRIDLYIRVDVAFIPIIITTLNQKSGLFIRYSSDITPRFLQLDEDILS